MTPIDPASFPPPQVAPRIPRLREALADAGCEAVLLTKMESVRYLTGFSGSAAMLLVTPEAALLTTDGRYAQQSEEQLAAAGVEAEISIGRIDAQLAALEAAVADGSRLGLEASSITWDRQQRLAEQLPVELVATRGLVEALRVVKDEGELARVEAACDVADVALAQVKSRLAEQPSESEFAAELEYEMRRRGASGPSFETIVASGPNAAMPHHRPGERVISEGDVVVIDFGAIVDGYHSDMTRTIAIGPPSAEMVDLLDAVLASQRAGVRAVRAGVSGEEVDEAARSSLGESGYGAVFLHSTGHGIGLEIHEAPWAAPGATDILAVGSVLTVEPGAYLQGRGGVRIEDSLLVTEEGCRPLTKSTKDYSL